MLRCLTVSKCRGEREDGNYNPYFHPMQKMRIKVRVNTMVWDEIWMRSG